MNSAAKKTILVIDDSALILRTATVILGERYNVLTAKGADIALSFIRQADMSVDLIVLDIQMPGMDGFEFLKIFKKMPSAENIPVIMLSAASIGNNVVHAVKLGVKGFLKKPVDPNELNKRVDEILTPKEDDA